MYYCLAASLATLPPFNRLQKTNLQSYGWNTLYISKWDLRIIIQFHKSSCSLLQNFQQGDDCFTVFSSLLVLTIQLWRHLSRHLTPSLLSSYQTQIDSSHLHPYSEIPPQHQEAIFRVFPEQSRTICLCNACYLQNRIYIQPICGAHARNLTVNKPQESAYVSELPYRARCSGIRLQ